MLIREQEAGCQMDTCILQQLVEEIRRILLSIGP